MKEISFTSAIHPVSLKEFSRKAASIGEKYFVDFPWSMEQAVKAEKATTRGVNDCTMFGISDGREILMEHLCPDIELNHSTYFLKQHIARYIDTKSPFNQAVVIGSKPDKKSQSVYSNVINMLKYFNIPYTELKISETPVNIAYISSSDEYLLSSSSIDNLIKKGLDNETIINKTFKKVNISNDDYIA